MSLFRTHALRETQANYIAKYMVTCKSIRYTLTKITLLAKNFININISCHYSVPAIGLIDHVWDRANQRAAKQRISHLIELQS